MTINFDDIILKMILGYLKTEAEFRLQQCKKDKCADNFNCRETKLTEFGFVKPKDKQRKITDFMSSEEEEETVK